jgi:hypothetical protein
MDRDAQELQLLAIFQYVVAGMTALFGCFPIIHLAIGIAALSGHLNSGIRDPKETILFGWLFTTVAGAVILIMWTAALLFALVGRNLQKRRHRMFCVIVAGFECMMMPFGTVLGVFTIIVLMRPSVSELFDGGQNVGASRADE